jgi:hypothetical protein
VIEFPTKAMREEYIAKGMQDLIFAGFENNRNGTGWFFNFILSNGMKTEGKDNNWKYTTHIIPLEEH